MKLFLLTLLTMFSFTASAWEGYDSGQNTNIEIGSGNLVRPGQEIEIYDNDHGEYHNVEVQSITGSGSGAEVEVYDYGTGEYRTLEME